MRVDDLYNFVLVLGLTGIVIGVVLTILGKLGSTSGLTTDATEGINNVTAAIKTLPVDWMTIIVTIGALAVILGLVVAAFFMFRPSGR